jgi:methyl-accepting chemotaxis protein
MQLSSVIEALSRGDLTVTMRGQFEGDHALLQTKLNSTISSLAALVRQIEQAVGTIGSAASDIAEGNGNLNTRTQEQASSLEETAASLEELTATVKQNAGNAGQANQLAAGARDAAQKGGQVVDSAVSAMGAITDSSKKVSDIIGEIDTASDQQASGIDQINAAVAQMDKNTQQNAAMVEQATAAAESLTDQARNMAELVRFFKVGDADEQSAERVPLPSVSRPKRCARVFVMDAGCRTRVLAARAS